MLGNLGGHGRVEGTAEFKGGDWSGAVVPCEGRLRGRPCRDRYKRCCGRRWGLCDCVGWGQWFMVKSTHP